MEVVIALPQTAVVVEALRVTLGMVVLALEALGVEGKLVVLPAAVPVAAALEF
jgi:hypothetical protein